MSPARGIYREFSACSDDFVESRAHALCSFFSTTDLAIA